MGCSRFCCGAARKHSKVLNTQARIIIHQCCNWSGESHFKFVGKQPRHRTHCVWATATRTWALCFFGSDSMESAQLTEQWWFIRSKRPTTALQNGWTDSRGKRLRNGFWMPNILRNEESLSGATEGLVAESLFPFLTVTQRRSSSLLLKSDQLFIHWLHELILNGVYGTYY